jgi:hypothetical protein
MSPVAAAVLALITPRRWWSAGVGQAAPLRPDRLSGHLLRDIGLADGRDRRDRERVRER